jgi:hypothetical protein
MAEVGEEALFFDAEPSSRKDSDVFGFGDKRHHDGYPGGVG